MYPSGSRSAIGWIDLRCPSSIRPRRQHSPQPAAACVPRRRGRPPAVRSIRALVLRLAEIRRSSKRKREGTFAGSCASWRGERDVLHPAKGSPHDQ